MNWKASISQSGMAFHARDDVILKHFSSGNFDQMLNVLRDLLKSLAIQTCCKLHGIQPGHMNKLTSLLSRSVLSVTFFKLTEPKLIFTIVANI